LCRYSEEWARQLALREHLEHRQNSDYGENIFCNWSSSPSYYVTGQQPVDEWYSEIIYHDFGQKGMSLKSGKLILSLVAISLLLVFHYLYCINTHWHIY
jgi:hypothetical protein